MVALHHAVPLDWVAVTKFKIIEGLISLIFHNTENYLSHSIIRLYYLCPDCLDSVCAHYPSKKWGSCGTIIHFIRVSAYVNNESNWFSSLLHVRTLDCTADANFIVLTYMHTVQ